MVQRTVTRVYRIIWKYSRD